MVRFLSKLQSRLQLPAYHQTLGPCWPPASVDIRIGGIWLTYNRLM